MYLKEKFKELRGMGRREIGKNFSFVSEQSNESVSCIAPSLSCRFACNVKEFNKQ